MKKRQFLFGLAPVLLLLVWIVSSSARSLLKKSTSEDRNHSLLIIAGTQKSGTTALAAYLALHPNITMAVRKELHFFDKRRHYRRGINHYLSQFPDTNKATVYFGEATPFYIASAAGCQRIAQHFPRAKMIIVVREPVARAYSEYQMKARRVEEQQELLLLLQRHGGQVASCLHAHPLNFSALTSCVPYPLRNHGRWIKFTKALRLAVEKGLTWTEASSACYKPTYSTVPAFEQVCSARHEDKQPVLGNHTSYLFTPKRCWAEYKQGLELLPSLHRAFIAEVEDFKRCATTLSNVTASYRFHIDRMFRDRNLDILSEETWEEVLEYLEEAVQRCIKIRGGISRQYVYRSMYAVQLSRCFKFINRRQFYILGTEQLRSNVNQTMSDLLRFLRLPCDTSYLPQTRTGLQRIVKKLYPTFEGSTSWRLQSSYPPLLSDISDYLHTFFQPFNRLLFKMLDRDFSTLW